MTKEEIMKFAEFDSEKNAKLGIEDAERWEYFATQVEPQPMGTPKYIFRTGHAIASINEHKRLMPLIEALAESNEKLVKALTKIHYGYDNTPNMDIALEALADHAERMASIVSNSGSNGKNS